MGAKLEEDPSLPRLDSVRTLIDVSSVGFEWNLINDDRIIGFVVYRSGSGEGKGLQKIATIKNPYATHFYDLSLNPQTKYIYAFATLGQDGRISPKSNPIHIQTSFIDSVESVFAINSQPKTIKIIWSPHPNPSVDSYLLQRLDKAGQFQTIKLIPHRLSVEYFDTKLKDGETYTYRVIAQNHEGVKSKPSEGVSVATIPQPAPINNVKASDNLPKAIEIQWDEAQEAEGIKKKYYKILYSTNDKDYKTLATTNQTNYTHKLKAGEDGVSYYYQVVLLGENGLEGHMSTTPAKGVSLPPPDAPLYFKGEVQNNQAILSWEAPEDERVKGYIVYRKEGSLWEQSSKFIDIEQPRFIDKEMRAGKTYKYSVVSVDQYGIESAPTSEIKLPTNPAQSAE